MPLNPYESPREVAGRQVRRDKPFLSEGGWWALVILLVLFSIVVINSVQVEYNRRQRLPMKDLGGAVEDAQP